MNPMEHEGTVALEAACKKWWSDSYEIPWETVDPIVKQGIKENFLPMIWAALEALPEKPEVLEEGLWCLSCNTFEDHIEVRENKCLSCGCSYGAHKIVKVVKS